MQVATFTVRKRERPTNQHLPLATWENRSDRNRWMAVWKRNVDQCQPFARLFWDNVWQVTLYAVVGESVAALLCSMTSSQWKLHILAYRLGGAVRQSWIHVGFRGTCRRSGILFYLSTDDHHTPSSCSGPFSDCTTHSIIGHNLCIPVLLWKPPTSFAQTRLTVYDERLIYTLLSFPLNTVS